MLRSSRYPVARGFVRPALRREDDPLWWDAHQARLAQIDADHSARDPATWTSGKQRALLLIERSAIALDCVAHMNGGMRAARQEDFAELRKEGYAVRPLGERYHRLTPAGIRAARDCIAAVAKQLGLHYPTYNFDSWNEHKVRCTCGWAGYAGRQGNANPRATLTAAVNHHLADPQAWIRARERTTAIIDRCPS